MKMKKITSAICSLFMLSLCFAGAAAANPGSAIQQGSSELGGQISLEGSTSTTEGSSTEYDSSTATLGITYGYFVTDAIQLAGRYFSVSSSSGTDGTVTNETTYSYLYLEGKYHFYSKGQTFIPYVGVGIGTASMTSESPGYTYSSSGSSSSLMGGVKYFVSENTSLNTELNVGSAKFDTTTTNTTRLLIGFSVYF